MLEAGKDWPSWRGRGDEGRETRGRTSVAGTPFYYSNETSEQAATRCG